MAEGKTRQQKSGRIFRNNSLHLNYEPAAAVPHSAQTTSPQNHVSPQTYKTYNTHNVTMPTAAAQNYVWSDCVQSLREFVSKHKLPAIARLLNSAGELPQALQPPSTSHHHQQQQQQSGPVGPLAVQSQGSVVRIHEVGKRKVVLARRVHWEKRQNDFVVSGEQVDIPAPFQGWFEAAPEDGRTVEHCDTVGALCGDKPRQFLVRTPTVAYRRSEENGAHSCWMPCDVAAGEVLNTGTVYDHMPNVRSANSRAPRAAESGKRGKRSRSVSPGRGFLRRLLKPSRSKAKAEQEYKYLQCFDSTGQEITIPLATTGIFSPVGDPTLASYDAVYQLQDLILAFGLPVNAQLIHSSAGEKKVCPEGVLRLYGTREEEMAVLSRLQLGQDDLPEDTSQPEKVEVSLDRNLQLQLGKAMREKEKQQAACASSTASKTEEPPARAAEARGEDPGHVELPKCVSKELKKFKSTGILDKLSVRAMRRDRSKVRENSSSTSPKQVAHHDLCYEDFFNGLDKPDSRREGSTPGNTTLDRKADHKSEKAHNSSRQESPHESSGSNDTSSSTNGQRRLSLQQNRDLPPLPRRTPLTLSPPGESSKGSKDSLYDHLPPAPTPPHQRSKSDPTQIDHHNDGYSHLDNNNNNNNNNNNGNNDTNNDDDDDDGYMVPSDLPAAASDPASPVQGSQQVHYRSPAAPQPPGKASRLKKCHSELFSADLQAAAMASDDSWHVDIDQLFSSTYSKKSHSLYGPVTTTAWTGSTSQLYDVTTKRAQASDAVTAWRADVERHQDRQQLAGLATGSLGRQSGEKLSLDNPSSTGRRGKRTPSHRINTTATLRSHNLRQPKASLLELFQFGDSFQDDDADLGSPSSSPSAPVPAVSSPASVGTQSGVGQSPFPAMSVARIGERRRRRESSYGELATTLSSPLPPTSQGAAEYRSRSSHFSTYAESEPLPHMYPRTPSLSAFSDPAYPKHGDDSAISVGSRDRDNPYGFTNGSDLSFYYDNGSGGTLTSVEECWSPPEDISGLSVQEVSRSLRYIGMKDRVVLRFANEQIDGNMLSSLDKRLLKEGFPELNALEIKKILDFVRGWRPKKR